MSGQTFEGEKLLDFFHRCTHQYGIDCANDATFKNNCPTGNQLYEQCQAKPFNWNETYISERIEANQTNNPCKIVPGCLEQQLFDIVSIENQRLFYIYAPIAAIMCIVAIGTNAVGLTGLSRITPKYPRHFLLISMSISDVMLSILTLLKKAGDVMGTSHALQRFVVTYLNVVWQTMFLASALMLLALAVEAFVALTATFFYEKFARRRLKVHLAIVAAWLVSFSFPFSLLLTGKSYDMTFQIAVSALLMLIIGVTIFSYLYAFLLAERARKEIRSQRKASHMLASHEDRDQRNSGRRKSLLTSDDSDLENHHHHHLHLKEMLDSHITSLVNWAKVCLLMTSSIVSWLPLNIYMMLGEMVEKDFPFYTKLLHAFLLMFHMNAIINPLTYTLRMGAVRSTLRRLLGIKSNKYLTTATVRTSATSTVKKLSATTTTTGASQSAAAICNGYNGLNLDDDRKFSVKSSSSGISSQGEVLNLPAQISEERTSLLDSENKTTSKS